MIDSNVETEAREFIDALLGEPNKNKALDVFFRLVDELLHAGKFDTYDEVARLAADRAVLSRLSPSTMRALLLPRIWVTHRHFRNMPALYEAIRAYLVETDPTKVKAVLGGRVGQDPPIRPLPPPPPPVVAATMPRETVVELTKLSDSQLDASMFEKIRSWSDPPTALQILEVLDACIFSGLASGFVVKLLQVYLESTMAHEGTTLDKLVEHATWRNQS